MGKTIFLKNPIIPKPEVEIWRTKGWPVGALQHYPPTNFGGPSPPASTFFWRSKLQKFSQKSPQRQCSHVYINYRKEDSRSRMLRLGTPLTLSVIGVERVLCYVLEYRLVKRSPICRKTALNAVEQKSKKMTKNVDPHNLRGEGCQGRWPGWIG